MKQIQKRFKRTVKYWRVSYKQSSERDRLLLGMFAFMVLVYTWWTILAF